jgi:hypothetical protein
MSPDRIGSGFNSFLRSPGFFLNLPQSSAIHSSTVCGFLIRAILLISCSTFRDPDLDLPRFSYLLDSLDFFLDLPRLSANLCSIYFNLFGPSSTLCHFSIRPIRAIYVIRPGRSLTKLP